MDKDNLRELLSNVLKPDTGRVKEATAKLKNEYYGSPQSLGLLLQILVSDDSIEIRQLAATEARKLVGKHWRNFPDGHKTEIRSRLLESTMAESSKVVRHASSRLVGAIAHQDLAKQQWTDLPGLVLQEATSPQAKAREVSTYILFSILDELDDDSSIFDYKKMFEAFSKTIQDLENPEVPMNTIFALSKVAIQIDVDGDEPALATFRQFIPKIASVLIHFINTSDTDHVTQTFECLQAILDSAAKIFDPHFKDLVQGMASIAADGSKDADTRTQAVNFLLGCLLERKMKFQSLRLGEQMTEMLFNILASEDAALSVEDDKDLTKSCLHLLGFMAAELAPPHVAGPAVVLFKKHASSPDIGHRQAAITLLATIIEGATDFVSTQLPELFPSILKLLNDPSDSVRESSVLACRDIADAVPDAVAKRHTEFLEALAKNLQSAVQKSQGDDGERHARVAANCCLAIDSLTIGLSSKEVKEYMPHLVPNLTRLFSHPSDDVKKASISAVGSIAVSARTDFSPYFDQVMGALSHYVEIKEPEEQLELRAMATDTMSAVAEAIGPDSFSSYVQPLIKASQDGLALKNARITESAYMLWGALAKTYKEEFKPFLPNAVKQLLGTLQKEEDADFEVPIGDASEELVGQEVIIAGKKIKVVGENDIDEDDDDEDDEDAWNDLVGFSEVSQEKETALEALADIYTHTGKEYLPYYEKTVESILPVMEHGSSQVVEAAVGAMFRLYAALWDLQPESPSKWKSNPGLPVQNQPSAEIAKIRDLLMTKVLSEYDTEPDNTLISQYNSNISECLHSCGPFLISGDGVVTKIIQGTIQIITKKHPCQQEEDDEEYEDEENSEDAWYTIESAFEVITGLAAALGPQFAELWKIFDKSVIAYASATSSTERSATVGALAEVIRGMKGGCTPWTENFLKILLHRLSDEVSGVKSNAAYGVGLLVEHSEDETKIKKALPSILSKLEPILQNDDPQLLDNASGCVARLISTYPDSVPINDVLPALVNLLPLKEDFEENAPVWSVIVKLYKSGNSTVQQLTSQIVRALETTLAEPDQMKEETKAEVAELVKYLQGKQPALVQQHPGLAKAFEK